MHCKNRRSWAFTLIEGLMTIAILGIITTLAFPKIHGVLDAGHDKQAVAKAHVLNAAKQSFKMRSNTALQEYASAGNDVAKYNLVHTYIPLSAANLKDFLPKGYALEMGDSLDVPIGLKKGSKTISY